MRSTEEKTYFVSYWLVALYFTVSIVFVVSVGVAVHASKTKCSCPEGTIMSDTEHRLDKRSIIDRRIPNSNTNGMPRVSNDKTTAVEDDIDGPLGGADKPVLGAAEEGCPTVPAPGSQVQWEDCKNRAWEQTRCAPEYPQCPDTQYRLPTDLIPRHYDIEIKADIYQSDPSDFNMEGWVTIFLVCMESTKTIILHKRETIDIERESLLVQKANSMESIAVDEVSEDMEKNFYTVHLGQVVRAGQHLSIFLHYTAPMERSRYGFFWYEYKEGEQTRYMAGTQFQTYFARWAFPCMDEPMFKATFSVKLWRKPWMTALSNMPHDGSILKSDGWIVDNFPQTPMRMSTYLLAFAIANFSYVSEISQNGHLLRHWGPYQYIEAGMANYTKSIAGQGLDFYENLFNLSYPLPKEDQIAIPGKSSAMENWGLITYAMTRLFWDPTYSTEYEKDRLTGTMFHELLHQWLGNTVTCEWWSDAWLNEAFARWYQHRGVAHIKPTWNSEHIFWRFALQRALHLDDTGTVHPLHNPTTQTRADTSEMFSSITYDKGGSVLRMVHHLVLGSTTMDEAMQVYVKRNEYRPANAYDLLQVWDEVASKNGVDLDGVTVTEIMETWILQQGYPLLTVKLQADKTSMDISQERFLQNPDRVTSEKYPSPFEFLYEVPFEYITSVQPLVPQKEWLHKDDRSFPLETPLSGMDSWVLVNFKQQGYFRVNYDQQNWNALTKQLNSDFTVLDPLNRAQIIDDSFSIAKEGSLGIEVALSTTEYLVNETEYIVWYSSSLGLDYIHNILQEHPDINQLVEYRLNLVQNIYNKVGWDDLPDDGHFDMILRDFILSDACKLGHPGCIQEAKRRFQNWKNYTSNLNIITPNHRGAAYCAAIAYGLPEDWDFLFERYTYFYKISHFSSIRTDMRNGLACSRSDWILANYFHMAANGDSRIHEDDRTGILTSIARNPTGRQLAWTYLSDNWDTAYMRTNIFTAITESFSTNSDREMVRQFMTDHPPASPDEKSYYNGIMVTIDSNIKWRNNNEDDIFTWVKTTLKK